VDDHDSFKQRVCSALDAFYHLLSPSKVSSVLSPNTMTSVKAELSTASPMLITTHGTAAINTSVASSSQDTNAQMLKLIKDFL
jgi:hypothetical protein